MSSSTTSTTYSTTYSPSLFEQALETTQNSFMTKRKDFVIKCMYEAFELVSKEQIKIFVDDSLKSENISHLPPLQITELQLYFLRGGDALHNKMCSSFIEIVEKIDFNYGSGFVFMGRRLIFETKMSVFDFCIIIRDQLTANLGKYPHERYNAGLAKLFCNKLCDVMIKKIRSVELEQDKVDFDLLVSKLLDLRVKEMFDDNPKILSETKSNSVPVAETDTVMKTSESPESKPKVNFCSNCGTKASGNFCSNCGRKY